MKQPILSILCAVYNHEPYLRDCLNGFVMQKTDFQFEAIVHDDASTDKSAEIIREYAEKYPNIIKPIFESENQYSKQDGSLIRIMNETMSHSSKYVAICEGDDYWTDPNKLQKQVDFLESHPEYTMVCNRTKLYSQNRKEIIGENRCQNKSGYLEPKNIIRKGGLYISTCSIIYRKEIKNNYPDYCNHCHVGDYPLQIMCAMKGRVYYMDEPMSVYRVDNPNSWVGHINNKTISEKRLKGILSEVNMLEGFANDYKQYKSYFRQRIAYFINNLYSINKKTNSLIDTTFNVFISKYTLFWKIDMIIKKTSNTHFIKGVYYRLTRHIFNKLNHKCP